MMKKLKFLIPALLLVSSATVWISCNSRAEELPQTVKIPVKVTDVLRKELAIPVLTSGQLSSKTEVKLAFKIGGIVETIYVDEGAAVKKGQLLASLNLAEISAQANQARSAFDKAKRDYQRVKNLYADSVATLEQTQDAATAVEVSQANLEIAEFNLLYSQIYAPADGKILKRNIERNELVAPGFMAFKFAVSGQDWIVRAGVIDRDILRIQLGDSANLNFDVFPDQRFIARVTEIAEARDPRSGTFEVELTLLPNTSRLKSGFIARVEITPSERRLYAIVPIEAMVEGEGKKGFVFALKSPTDSVQKIPVKIDHIFETGIGISAGLENVEQVISDGAPYLVDGSLVEVVGGKGKR